MKYIKLLVWLFSFFLAHVSASQTNCDLKKDDNDILVYLCDSEISNFKIIIVELDVAATLSQYAAIIYHVENYHEWQYNAVAPRLVTRISDTELYYYTQVDTPWPIANRDMIWHQIMKQDLVTKIITVDMVEMPDYLPKVEDVVRVPNAHSTLTITPIDKTNLHLRYVIDVDPGGAVPAWISNMFAALAPWHTFNTIRERIKAQGDNRITVPFIKDY